MFDAHFFEYLRNELPPKDQAEILRDLMYINNSSKEHKRNHALILESEFKKITSFPQGINEYLKGAVKPKTEVEFEMDSERISRTMRFGIYLTTDNPYKCYILTAPKIEEEYKQNTHYKGKISSVTVVSGEVSLNVIRNYFKSYTNVREAER